MGDSVSGPVGTSKIVVPPEEREKNFVDEQRALIDRIQEKITRTQECCEHDFRVLVLPKLSESFINGTYVGATSGPIGVWRDPNQQLERSALTFPIKCLKCSLKREASIRKTCPFCLSPMRDGGMAHSVQKRSGRQIPRDPRSINDTWICSREFYFGQPYIYYDIRIENCTGCRFTVASDEWNQ